jgi:UPF0716 protein FxsA
MPALLVLAFIIVPLVELLIVIQVGAAIGGWWTAGLLVLDSILGAFLLRVEGRRTWREFRTALEEGRWPGDEVAQGALVIVGGTLLLTPGFLTDVVGFLFLLSPTRRVVSGRLRARVARSATAPGPNAARGATGGASGSRPARVRGADGEEVVLDVEVVEIRRETRSSGDADEPPPAFEGPTPP